MPEWQESARDSLRRFGKWLRRGGQAATDWIDEKAAITSRLRSIRQLRSSEEQLFRDIGAKVYTLHTRGKIRNRDVLAHCRRVDDAIAQIARLRQEIEDIKRRSTRPEIQLMEIEDDEPLLEAEEVAEATPVEVAGEAAAAAPKPPEEESGELVDLAPSEPWTAQPEEDEPGELQSEATKDEPLDVDLEPPGRSGQGDEG